ncbi:hypothetical protein HAX54_012808, partial [Datura stramonium]|nr:hypothetical protein [Datura stramonium]
MVEVLQDQSRALDMIQNDQELSCLMLVQAPLVDVEIRGVPALQFLGDIRLPYTPDPRLLPHPFVEMHYLGLGWLK